jgi:hypothetical protein
VAQKGWTVVDAIVCEIRLKGHLAPQWTDRFGGLSVEHHPCGETNLSGMLADQAALFGVLFYVRDMGLALVSIRCSTVNPNTAQDLVGGQEELCYS